MDTETILPAALDPNQGTVVGQAAPQAFQLLSEEQLARAACLEAAKIVERENVSQDDRKAMIQDLGSRIFIEFAQQQAANAIGRGVQPPSELVYAQLAHNAVLLQAEEASRAQQSQAQSPAYPSQGPPSLRGSQGSSPNSSPSPSPPRPLPGASYNPLPGINVFHLETEEYSFHPSERTSKAIGPHLCLDPKTVHPNVWEAIVSTTEVSIR